MALFKPVFDEWMKIEGVYSNDKDDLGGETFCGIAREMNKRWPGWKLVDAGIRGGDEIMRLVEEFYVMNYWDRFLGDEIESQRVASELFDIAINRGVHASVLTLQRSLNILAMCPPTTVKISEDGVMGRKTLNALHREYVDMVVHEGGQKACSSLLKLLNILQGEHYVGRVFELTTQGKHLRGWLKRVSFKES